jgi:rubredoxin
MCGHIYDEALGDAASGIAPGTAWKDVPDSWICPDCGAAKDDFTLVEM